MVNVSENASGALKKIMDEKGLEGSVRIFLQQSCGGAQLALGLDETRDNDELSEFGGLTFVVDKELSDQTGEIKVDYVDDVDQPGFTLVAEKPITFGGSCGEGCSCGA